MQAQTILEVFDEVAQAIASSLGSLDDWGLAGARPGQYLSDLAADAVALDIFERAGFGVLSEESGLHRPDSDIMVVMDPLDGSTNASRGLPWFATSLCAVDRDGPLAALVCDLVSSRSFDAVRDGGARCNGVAIHPTKCSDVGEALVGLSGYPPHHLGWGQYRAFGASALDLCAVACGMTDGFVDCSTDAHGSWDYLGALLVCEEAGAHMTDAFGRDLVVVEHGARRTPVAAATPELLSVLLAARSGF